MSYTFSRRDFMKYSAVAAVAVAGSSMFTGCGSFSNPNRPYGTYKGEDCKLTFGGKSGGILGFGGTKDYLILKKSASYTSASRTLQLEFTHYPVSEGTSATAAYYQLKYVTADGNRYITSAAGALTAEGGGAGLEINKETQVKVTVTIPADVKDAVEGAEAVYIQYFPRHNALGKDNDSYSDVYATWDITSLFSHT